MSFNFIFIIPHVSQSTNPDFLLTPKAFQPHSSSPTVTVNKIRNETLNQIWMLMESKLDSNSNFLLCHIFRSHFLFPQFLLHLTNQLNLLLDLDFVFQSNQFLSLKIHGVNFMVFVADLDLYFQSVILQQQKKGSEHSVRLFQTSI